MDIRRHQDDGSQPLHVDGVTMVTSVMPRLVVPRENHVSVRLGWCSAVDAPSVRNPVTWLDPATVGHGQSTLVR